MSEESVFEKVAKKILTQNLQIRKGETYLFFTDFNSVFEERFDEMVARRRFLHRFFEGFSSLADEHPGGVSDKYESTGLHGSEPGENIWRLAFGDRVYNKLLREDYIWRLKGEVDFTADEWRSIKSLIEEFSDDRTDAIIAFPWYSVTHTRFRRLLTEAGSRFISMPMLTERVMSGPLMADWTEVSRITKRVYEILAQAESLSLTCPAGTNLDVKIWDKDRIHLDTGQFETAGSFGNLPAGEAYLVPSPASANGKVVFTSGPEYPSIRNTGILVENGKVIGFDGETPYADILAKKFQQDFKIRHIAELGIGTNPLARDVSSMIEGEKIQGTTHIALGDDSSIGGSNEATEHLDHIIVNPTLVARMRTGESVVIISQGELQCTE